MKVEFLKDYQALIDSFDKIKKEGANPHFKSSYVRLKDLLPVVKEKAKKHNFTFFQIPKVLEGKNVLVTSFAHSSGETLEGTIELVHEPGNPQKLGGSLTYMRRYMLTCMLQLEEEDDDGNFASGLTNKPSQDL